MNITLLKPAKTALIIFVLSLASSILVITGLTIYRTQKQQGIQKIDQQLADARERISKLILDFKTAEQSAQQYQRLNQLGFIGEADRKMWVQRLDNIYKDTHLPPTLRYTLSPPKLFNAQTVPESAPMAYRNNVLQHDLTIEMSDINDKEFLDFMAKLGTHWHVPYRVESCQISREENAIKGLQIKCTLQLYSLPDKAKQ